MKYKVFKSLVAIAMSGMFFNASAEADCAALYAQGSALAEPAECFDFLDKSQLTLPALASDKAVKAPTDLATGADIGFVSDNFIEHAQNNFPGQTVLSGTFTSTVFSMEYNQTLTTLYGVDSDTASLVTVNPATGAITSVGPLTNMLVGQNPSGIAIDGNGTCYVTGTDGTQSSLYTCDLGTGTLTLVGSQATSGGLIIDLVATCAGELFAHDIGSDSIFSLSPVDGSATLIGATGVNSNFAQGMTYDRQDGTIYAYTYQGGGANVYGTINPGTGALTPLATDNPLGEFVGASRTICAPVIPPAPEVVPVNSWWMLLMLAAGLLVFTIRRNRIHG